MKNVGKHTADFGMLLNISASDALLLFLADLLSFPSKNISWVVFVEDYFQALLRPGRFDRHIIIDLPTALERQEMFEIYLSKIVLDHKPRYYSKRLAQMTPRFSGLKFASLEFDLSKFPEFFIFRQGIMYVVSTYLYICNALNFPISLLISELLGAVNMCLLGADIANIVNEAAIRAASAKKKEVTVEDLDASLQRVLAGSICFWFFSS